MKNIILNYKLSKGLSIAILALYAIALFTNSFTGSGGVLGLYALGFGVFTVIFGLFPAFIAWCANITFMIAFSAKNTTVKLVFSSLTVLMGSAAILVHELPMHEGAATSPVKAGIGFYFWISSFGLLLMESILTFKRSG